MSGYAFGEVKSLYKYDDGYEVTAAVMGDGASFQIEVRTQLEDPQAAIEAVREYLANLGANMATTFREPGSLK